MQLLRVLAFTALFATTGCAGRVDLRELSMGRYGDPPQALFDRVLAGVQVLGYEPTAIDAEHGNITIASAYRSRREGTAELRIQLYREGWIAVTISGGPVRRNAAGASVPGDLATEYQAFVLGLREHVEGLGRGELGR